MKCSKEDYAFLQRLRNRLMMAKIDLRKVEEAGARARKEGRLEEAEKEAKLQRSYVSLVREIEDQVGEMEKRCF